MCKHAFKLLLLLLGVAATVVLFVHYEVHKIILAWFWSLEDTLIFVAKTFCFRRAFRPLWNFLTRVAVIGCIGFNRWGDWRRRVLEPIKHRRDAIIWRWHTARWAYRTFIVLCACGLFAAIVVATVWLPLLLPISVWVIRKLWYWLGDQLFDQGSYYLHPKYWKNRIIHRTPLLMRTLRPLRHEQAVLERFLETWREGRERGLHQEQDREKPPL